MIPRRLAAGAHRSPERVVVGTRTQTISVAPEGVEPVEKTITEDIVEWVCPPSLLALASDPEEAMAS